MANDLSDRIGSSAKDSAKAFLSTTIGQTLVGGVKEVDPEIQKLVGKVMEAAGGKPLKISITEQRYKQEMLEKLIQQLATSGALQAGGSQASGAPQGNVRPAEGSVQKPSDQNGDSSPVTQEDLMAIKESIDALATGLAERPE